MYFLLFFFLFTSFGIICRSHLPHKKMKNSEKDRFDVAGNRNLIQQLTDDGDYGRKKGQKRSFSERGEMRACPFMSTHLFWANELGPRTFHCLFVCATDSTDMCRRMSRQLAHGLWLSIAFPQTAHVHLPLPNILRCLFNGSTVQLHGLIAAACAQKIYDDFNATINNVYYYGCTTVRDYFILFALSWTQAASASDGE